MAATIGKLVVTLQARTAKFRKGMARAGKRVKAFASNLRRVGARVAKFGAIIAAAALAGMVFFTKKAFEAIDATAKLSKQLGISIDGLRGLGRAAELTGAGQASLQKGLGFLTKALGEAKSGIGEGKQALESLGLSAEDIIALPLDETVGIIADRMNTLTTQSEKAFVASKLFGRGGLALVNTLALGSRGLKEMAAKSLLLQGSLSAFDAGKVEEANDAIADMRMSWTGFFDRVAVATAPFVKHMADQMTRVFIWWRKQANEAIPRIIEWFKWVAVAASTMAKGIWKGIKDIPANVEWTVIEVYKIWNLGLFKMEEVWLTFEAVMRHGLVGLDAMFLDVLGTLPKEFNEVLASVGDIWVRFVKWVAKVTPGKSKWMSDYIAVIEGDLKNIEDLLEPTAPSPWEKFWARDEKGRDQLLGDLDALKSEMQTIQSSLIASQAALLRDGKEDETWLDRLFADMGKIDLTGMGESFKAGGKLAGQEFVKSAKSITVPGAIEAGTVEAYSATVKASYKSLAENGKKTVDELKESNNLQRETNRRLLFLGPRVDTETIAFS